MTRFLVVLSIVLLVLSLGPPLLSLAQPTTNLPACADCAYSTEEDFVTQGPTPADGNTIISDGDLLSCTGAVCMRNADLLQQFDVTVNLGLDAADVLDVEQDLVAFSTELDSPYGTFTAGDLLSTWGTVVPNKALLLLFQVEGDRGLDAVHFVGDAQSIVDLHGFFRQMTRAEWLEDPGLLATELKRFGVDIWFSIEGTEMRAATFSILDGDLLSAANGTIVAKQADLFPATVPAGIPTRGVDFGLDAVTATRSGVRSSIRHSPEILYRGEFSFTDGDVLRYGDGLYYLAKDLYNPLEPKADFLGTDAFYRRISEDQARFENFMTLVYRMFVAQPLARPIVGIGKSERARLPLPDSAGSAVVPGRRR